MGKYLAIGNFSKMKEVYESSFTLAKILSTKSGQELDVIAEYMPSDAHWQRLAHCARHLGEEPMKSVMEKTLRGHDTLQVFDLFSRLDSRFLGMLKDVYDTEGPKQFLKIVNGLGGLVRTYLENGSPAASSDILDLVAKTSHLGSLQLDLFKAFNDVLLYFRGVEDYGMIDDLLKMSSEQWTLFGDDILFSLRFLNKHSKVVDPGRGSEVLLKSLHIDRGILQVKYRKSDYSNVPGHAHHPEYANFWAFVLRNSQSVC